MDWMIGWMDELQSDGDIRFDAFDRKGICFSRLRRSIDRFDRFGNQWAEAAEAGSLGYAVPVSDDAERCDDMMMDGWEDSVII